MLFALPAGASVPDYRSDTRLLGLGEQVGWVMRTTCHRAWQWWTAPIGQPPVEHEGREETSAQAKAALLDACTRLGLIAPDAAPPVIRNPDIVAMQEVRELASAKPQGRA